MPPPRETGFGVRCAEDVPTARNVPSPTLAGPSSVAASRSRAPATSSSFPFWSEGRLGRDRAPMSSTLHRGPWGHHSNDPTPAPHPQQNCISPLQAPALLRHYPSSRVIRVLYHLQRNHTETAGQVGKQISPGDQEWGPGSQVQSPALPRAGYLGQVTPRQASLLPVKGRSQTTSPPAVCAEPSFCD